MKVSGKKERKGKSIFFCELGYLEVTGDIKCVFSVIVCQGRNDEI